MPERPRPDDAWGNYEEKGLVIDPNEAVSVSELLGGGGASAEPTPPGGSSEQQSETS